jgi:hypothetical protein
MALADSSRAIGAVSDAIAQRLTSRTGGLAVSVGRPEPGNVAPADRLNLFLYEVQFDASLKNVPLDEGQRAPTWLVLKYLLTAFDHQDGKTSDGIGAYENLGAGIRALQELAVLPIANGLPGDVIAALSDNPEDITITFDEAPTELLSKVMQGSDEKYRLSIAFQARPVMIATREPASYSLLVGVDYTTTPATTIGEAGIHIPVLPSLGPVITTISPAKFELGSTVTIFGTDLHLSHLSVRLGSVDFPATMQQPDRLQFVVSEDVGTGDVISAGSLTVSVTQLLPTGRRRSSNLLVGRLMPILDTATIVAGSLKSVPAQQPHAGWKFATLDLTGKLLGKDDSDDFYLALLKDGATVKVFDALKDIPVANAPQTHRQFEMQEADAVPPGQYVVVYRVNGEQARQSMTVDLR